MGTAPEQKTESAKDGKDSMSLPSFQSIRVQQVAPTVSPPGSVGASALKCRGLHRRPAPFAREASRFIYIIWRGLAALSTSEYAFWLHFYAFGQKPLTNIFISFLIKSNYSSKENILIKFKPKNSNEKSIDKIMEDCEQYRKDLIRYCHQFFEYEYEYAEDCVQEAYVALLESLNNGIEIKNYKSWLYAVVLNYKNKVIKDKIKRNESDFTYNEEKDVVIENSKAYNPDYIDQMTTDKMIEEQALHIISQLNPDEKKLYILYYWKHKKLKDLAIELNVKYDTIRKRHEKLKKKLNSKIKNFENL